MIDFDITVIPSKFFDGSHPFTFSSSHPRAMSTAFAHHQKRGLTFIGRGIIKPGFLPDKTEDLIVHEDIHHVLGDFINLEASIAFDNLCYPVRYNGKGFGTLLQNFMQGKILR